MEKKIKIVLVKENGNEITVQPTDIPGLLIKVDPTCENCIVKLHEPIKFAPGSMLDIKGKNTNVELETSRFFYNIHLLTSNSVNQKLYVGKNCSTWTGFFIHLTEDDANVHIGNDCMLSKNITIWASDGYAIIDCITNDILNLEKKGVYIGNRVWISADVIFTKNARVLDGSVVGTGSVVTTSFEESNILIAGNPARILKHNINWYRGKPKQIQEDILRKQGMVVENKFPKVIAIIPSRYASSRFPGKPLADILGKPMIQWVYEKVSSVPEISEVYVATDDERIFDTVTKFGGKAIMTGECSCGSDRVYQACEKISADIVLNIQGDEPSIKTEMIRDLISAFNDSDVQMATLKKEITPDEDVNNQNMVKVITDVNDNALYFSRSAIPYNRDGIDGVKYYKHIGVYGYTKEFLKKFVNMPQSSFEKTESLEQLRAIENGYKIRVIETKYQSIGVDLPEHIALVEEELKQEGLV